MKPYEFAQLTDISVVRSRHSLEDVRNVAKVALQYRFRNVHSLPCYTAELSKLIGEQPDVFVGAPVGFPSGGALTEVKCLEAKKLLKDGAKEIDIVMNVGRLKDGDLTFVENELKEIITLCEGHALTKVIVEMNVLSDVELEEACQVVIESGADFLKTGTGWVPAPLDLNRIATLKKRLGNHIKLKVAGGIRSLSEIDYMVELGVERFGLNDKTAVDLIHLLEQNA
ncbi:MAG TPA: deoxyribose-phosphate aldolase [Fastidiosipila sp.]|nr:deoxyribose-phosphate aldolase [Fastidiosipila sp.]